MGTIARSGTAAFLFVLLPCRPFAESPPQSGDLRVDLSVNSMESLLSFGASGYAGRCVFSAGEEGASLIASLALGEGLGGVRAIEDDGGAGRGGGRFLIAGPGGAAGLLRPLADPCSYSSTSFGGGPIALDPSLEAGTATLCAGSGALAAFSLASGLEAGLLVKRPEATEAATPSWTAAGLGFRAEGGEGLWSGAAALSLREARLGGGGWEPDPAPDPAGSILLGCLARERLGAAGRAAFALCASAGRSEGPGLAARLEASGKAGPIAASIAAARAGRGFRCLSGARAARALALAGDLRLALRKASNLGLALRLESPRCPPGTLPAFGCGSKLRLELPFGGGRRLIPRLGFSRESGGAAAFELGLDLFAKGDSWERKLELGLEAGEGAEGRRFRAGLDAKAEVLGLEWRLALALSRLEAGEGGASFVGEASFGLALGLGGPGEPELLLGIEGPDGGVALAPLSAGAEPARPVLSLRYATSF